MADSAPRIEPWGGRRLVWLAALVGCAAAFLLIPSLHERLLDVSERAGELIRGRQAAGMLVFVVLAALSAMLAFVSSAVLIPVAVHVWGPVLCAVLLWIGWFLGGVAAYVVGRYLGRPIVERLVRPATIARYETWVRPGVALVPILLVQMALPSDATGYVFGVVRCRPAVFLVALALAEVPYAIAAVVLGASFLERNLLPLLLLGLVAAAVGIWGINHLHRHVASAAG